MKKLISLTIIAASILSSAAFSQDTRYSAKRKNVVSVNMTSALISHYGISYERAISKKMSVRLYSDFSYFNYKMDNDNLKMRGFGVVPEFRYYVSKKGSPQGYFIGLYAPIRNYNIEGTITEDNKLYRGEGTYSYYGFGFVNGPQFLLGNRISLSIPFGFSVGASVLKGDYVYSNPESNTDERIDADIPLVGSSIIPRFSVDLGIAF